MREKYFLLTFLFFFLLVSLFLTFRQETLFQNAEENFVAISFVEPENREDWRFTITQTSDLPRTGILLYTFEDGRKEESTVTLTPHEEKIFEPTEKPVSIIFRYQNNSGEERIISLSQ